MNKFLIRFFDITFSFVGLVLLSPVLLVVALLIVADSKGGVFFRQVRVGKNNRDFLLWKFRTMTSQADQAGLITVGKKDARITRAGHFLRRSKLDELPQLINVLKGEMSLVGPRPEVRKYVDLYTKEQLKILAIKPGITDLASIAYINENELLGKAENPEKVYIEQIMPEKIILNMKFIEQRNLKNYFYTIFKTISKIISANP